MGPDKIAAYNTLYSVLAGTVRLLASFVPFVTEEIHQALRSAFGREGLAESVHLEDLPESDPSTIDADLEAVMDTAIRVSALGRTVRNEAGVKIRQPLAKMFVRDNGGRTAKLLAHDEIRDIVLDELHVKDIAAMESLDKYATIKAKPAFPVLGKRFGKGVPQVAAAIESLGPDVLQEFLRGGEITVQVNGDEVKLGRDDMSVQVEGREPYGAWAEHGVTVAISLEIDEELRTEGMAREIVNRLQKLRKKAGYHVSDRIRIRYTGGNVAEGVFDKQGGLIQNETLAVATEKGDADWADETEFDVDGQALRLWIRRESD